MPLADGLAPICGNADAVGAALGWEVIRGFVVFELAEGGDKFVAHKRWWNAKETGVWVDFTPRPEGLKEMVLVESALSTKAQVPVTDATKAAAAARFELGGLVAGASPAPAPAASTPVKSDPSKPLWTLAEEALLPAEARAALAGLPGLKRGFT